MKTFLWIAAILSITPIHASSQAQPTLNREVTGKIGILNPKTTVEERNAAKETLKFEPRRMTYPVAQSTVEKPLMGESDSELEWLDASMRKFCDNESAVYDDVNLTCAVPQDPQ